ncbi:MAG TPA: Gfo/Idh/MocA family oxidoreductase [Patescibacteria group bacterium]|nr:Gfo/Idh/MocA family oxidoreductase [Patescibacteria group bacterium]
MKGVTKGQTVRFGIIGCGRIAQSHLQALATLPEAKLAVAVENRKAAGEAVAEEHKCVLYADYREPAILDSIDAAIICTPPSLHHDIARHFLERGVHVLCEKPLTIQSEQARSLVALSRERDLLLMMASKFRYVDDIIKAKAIIESGILGRIVMYENSFCSKISMQDRWNADRGISGGGVLIDNGSHSADIARYLLGPIVDVQAQNGIAWQGLDVEDTVRVQFLTQGGVIGTFDLSWTITKESPHYVQVFGSDGTLQIGWSGSKYRQDGSSKWVPFGSGYDKLKAFARQLGNFVGCLKGRELPIISAEDSLASVQVVEAAYRSASRNNWLRVDGAA